MFNLKKNAPKLPIFPLFEFEMMLLLPLTDNSPFLKCFSMCCLKLPLLVYEEWHTEHTYVPFSGLKAEMTI